MSGQGLRKVGPYVVMNGLDADTNQSAEIDIGNCSSVTLLFWWSDGSSLSGVFEVDVLRRQAGINGDVDDEWHKVGVSPTLLATGAKGDLDAVLSGDVRKVRVRWVKSAGTGKVYASYNATTRG